jgi:hypothetical protein
MIGVNGKIEGDGGAGFGSIARGFKACARAFDGHGLPWGE